MAGSSSPRPDDNDRLRLPVTSSPRTRGAEKKESTDLRLSQPCPPYVTPSSISSFGRRLIGVHTAENKSLKNTGANRFCQSSARPCTYKTGRWRDEDSIRVQSSLVRSSGWVTEWSESSVRQPFALCYFGKSIS